MIDELTRRHLARIVTGAKPRVRLLFRVAEDDSPRWVCEFGAIRGYGAAPRTAYENWKRRMTL